MTSIRDNLELMQADNAGDKAIANDLILDYIWIKAMSEQKGAGTIVMNNPAGIPI